MIVQVKGNQPELYREIQEAIPLLAPVSESQEDIEKSRNRLEQRRVRVYRLGDYLIESESWVSHMTCVVEISRRTELYNSAKKHWERQAETHYYAANWEESAAVMGAVIRGHWSIENKNHYVRDVSLGEDASRIRHNPGIMARLRSLVLNILRFNQVSNIREALFCNALNFDRLLAYRGFLE